MYIVSDSFGEELTLVEGERQVVFSSTRRSPIIEWLLAHGFHESFVEDIQSEEQSITYEDGENFQFIVVKHFQPTEEHPLLYDEVNIFIIISSNKIFFLCDDNELVQRVIDRFRRRYRRGDTIEYITYTLLDILIDMTMQTVELIDDRLEEIEDRILESNVDEEEIQKSLYFARRSLSRISKASVLEHDVINKLYNHFPTTLRKRLRFEFIDLKEHLAYLINESKSHLDRTGYLQNLMMGFISNRMNRAMQRLTGITLIFLPLTFIVGNYGMNFRYMPELQWRYGYLAVWLLNTAIALAIYLWLRRKKWI
ncbi:MAG: magnesium transporter CorA family protein [Epsilonproteobacteria bacterium]|nr:magnesium transporter [Campylobacterota bacterium]NPA56475.1 magnesium transporter CorA family protein [Campylobacterota bacterium]